MTQWFKNEVIKFKAMRRGMVGMRLQLFWRWSKFSRKMRDAEKKYPNIRWYDLLTCSEADYMYDVMLIYLNPDEDIPADVVPKCARVKEVA